MCEKSRIADNMRGGRENTSALAAYGSLDSCRDVMRAYELYKYNLYKEKYCNNGSIGKFGKAE